jgi:FkbM family methyltransferase
MILDPTDLIQEALLVDGYYERATCDLHRKLLKAGDTYLDIGANAGVYTLLASQCVGPTGRVIAVEPNPVIFVRLVENLGLNKFASNVQPVACAAWSTIGLAHLSGPPAENCGLARLIDTKLDRSIGVCTQPISMVLRFAGASAPDVMKIDIEGNEYEVLLEMLDSGIEPRHIISEYLPNHFPAHRMLPELLRDRGYELRSASGGPLEHVCKEDSNIWASHCGAS